MIEFINDIIKFFFCVSPPEQLLNLLIILRRSSSLYELLITTSDFSHKAIKIVFLVSPIFTLLFFRSKWVGFLVGILIIRVAIYSETVLNCLNLIVTEPPSCFSEDLEGTTDLALTIFGVLYSSLILIITNLIKPHIIRIFRSIRIL
jgi:hypothetical protein